MTEWNDLKEHEKEHANQLIGHVNNQDNAVLAQLKNDSDKFQAWAKGLMPYVSVAAVLYVFKRLSMGR
ncbi:hypothetical protein [Trichormus variabilis]|uniref:Uncharacterized protein n=1 Tax=Trichormus variabilis SAG 1403-4b TaxID=447716 RepID=A0A433UTR8_ANAVA|nr:hypothetical protein [Trichormus variabilis]MBD2627863.1 hypothetical protein [Trichormus variabilis FACHB-164]RUS97243.1 hypothetical protein DSM107003_19840 [Trichormus variabilis SAG 1403-4b]